MKQLKKLLFVGLIFLGGIFTSCSEESQSVSYKSPGEKTELNFTGKRATSLDPWMVGINVKGYGFDDTIATELYIGSIDSSTIIVDWANDNEASVTLKQRDSDDKKMKLQISENGVSLK